MIEQYVVDAVLADSTVAALVTNRVFPVVVRQETVWPLLTYKLLNGSGEYTLAGVAQWRTAQIELIAWAQDYKSAKTLADAVRRALDAFSQREDTGPIRWITVAEGADDYVDELGAFGAPLLLQVEYNDWWVEP